MMFLRIIVTTFLPVFSETYACKVHTMTVKIFFILCIIVIFSYDSFFVEAAQNFKHRNLKSQKVKHPQPVVEQLLDYDYEDYNYIDDLPDKQTVIDRGNAIFFFS